MLNEPAWNHRCHQQEKQEWYQQFIGLSLQEANESLILLEKKPGKDKIQRHSEGGQLGAEWIIQIQCDRCMMKNHKENADTLGQVNPPYSTFV